MSKKNKKSEVTLEATQNTKKSKNKVKGVAGLRVAQAICYVLTFPVMILLAFLICMKIGDGAPNYTFWPYVSAIILALFGLIFLIVALIVNRKGTKRKAMQRTVSMLICVVVLTGVFGLAFDVILPDTIQNLTSNTLLVEDAFNNYEEKADEIIGYAHEFARLNLLNGNYDGRSYDVMKKDADVIGWAADYASLETASEYLGWDEENGCFIERTYTKGLSDLDIELYNWIYTNYVLTDYDYAFASEPGYVNSPANDPSGYTTVGRHAFCRALVDQYSEAYKKLCEEGIQSTGLLGNTVSGNPKLSWLFAKNYASMDLDGYLALNDDSGLGYATDNRMSIPVVLRLILNDRYSITDNVNLEKINVNQVTKNGIKATTYAGYFVYMHRPEIAAEIQAANAVNYENGLSTTYYRASDDNYYFVYEEGGYVEGLVTWCVLDMLGTPMAVASMDNLTTMLVDLVGERLPGMDVTDIINDMLTSNADELLNEKLMEVIKDATNGQRLYLTLCYNDQGQTEINLVPQAVEVGVLGYQYMSWLELGHLLVTICGVLSLRNILYIFGAVAVVMVFAIGVLSAQIEKKKEAAANEPEVEEVEDELLDLGDEVLDEIA